MLCQVLSFYIRLPGLVRLDKVISGYVRIGQDK
jgi:hypothetical protein